MPKRVTGDEVMDIIQRITKDMTCAPREYIVDRLIDTNIDNPKKFSEEISKELTYLMQHGWPTKEGKIIPYDMLDEIEPDGRIYIENDFKRGGYVIK